MLPKPVASPVQICPTDHTAMPAAAMIRVPQRSVSTPVGNRKIRYDQLNEENRYPKLIGESPNSSAIGFAAIAIFTRSM